MKPIEIYYGVLYQSPVWSGLTSYWRCNETSGTSVPDTLNFANGTSSDLAFVSGGIRDYCLSGNTAGTTGVGCGNVYNFERTQKWTCNCWVNLTTSALAVLFGRQNGAPNYGGWYMSITSANKIEFNLANHYLTNAITTRTNTTFSNGAWTMCSVSYNGTSLASGVTFYINGTVVTDVTVVRDSLSATTQTGAGQVFTIGGYNLSGATVRGKFDEAAIWNRVLSADEITELYNKGIGVFR